MEEVRKNIYDIISLVGVPVFQGRPEKIKTIPCITFNLTSDVPIYTLIREVATQRVEVTVDIWSETTKQSGSILRELEAKMRENDYRLVFKTDVADPEGYSHLNLRFEF